HDEGCTLKPRMSKSGAGRVTTEHETLGAFEFHVGADAHGAEPNLLFTDNESNLSRLWGAENVNRYVKDGIGEYIIRGNREAVNAKNYGTKVAAHYALKLKPGEQRVVRLRLHAAEESVPQPLGREFDEVFAQRI